MKQLLLIAGALYLGNVAHAQITLSSSSYPASLLGTDSLKKTAYNSPFPSFAPMSGGFCDMTSVVDTSPLYLVYRVPSFSAYDFADSNEYSFVGHPYKGNVLSTKNTVSIAELGTEIFSANHSLTTTTAGPFDSLFIPAQMSSLSSAHEKIHFPITLGSFWYSTWSSDVNFELSIAALFLYHTPCIIRRYSYESNAVIGWGEMRINETSGIPSDYLDVLQVKTTTYTIDSFFLSGAPMPSIVVIALNLTQGKADTIYAQNFYREQEVTPLANVLFRDAGFMQPYKATTHVQRLKPVQVSDVAAQGMAVFPNPLQGRILTVQLPGSSANWNYELINLSGATIQSGSIVGAKSGTLEISEAAGAGVYFLRLNDGNRVYSQQIIITQ